MLELKDLSETPSKRQRDDLTKEQRKLEQWIEDNDIIHQYDGHYVTEIEERKSKILDERQRIVRYEGNIENYKEQLQKTVQDMEALGVDENATERRVKKKMAEIEKIRDATLKAQNSRDHYDAQRKKYNKELKEHQQEHSRIKKALDESLAKAIDKVPNRPEKIPANEEKERLRIASIRDQAADDAELIKNADLIEEHYKTVTEVWLYINLLFLSIIQF